MLHQQEIFAAGYGLKSFRCEEGNSQDVVICMFCLILPQLQNKKFVSSKCVMHVIHLICINFYFLIVIRFFYGSHKVLSFGKLWHNQHAYQSLKLM